MTIGPDGVPLTWTTGHRVTPHVETLPDGTVIGLINCEQCGDSWQHAKLLDPDREYARRYIQTITGWAALAHAKACPGEPT